MSSKSKPGKIKSQSGPYIIPWNKLNFERLQEQNKIVAKYLFCNKILKNIGHKRLLGHRNVCSRPQNIDVRRTSPTSENSVISRSELTNNENSEESVGSSTIFLETARLNQIGGSHQSESEHLTEMDEKLGLFFFGCGIPLHVVESKHFINFVSSLNPNYKPPTRKTLSGKILDQIYDQVESKTSSSETDKSVLLVDGWKNSSKNEKYVVGIIHNADGKRHFLNSWDFTEKSENTINLKEVTEEAEKEAKEKYNIEIYAVVSDNVSAMVSMGKTINQWHTTCDGHSGNLLAKYLVESTLNAKVLKVLKEFKTPYLERKLVKLGGSKISLPGETRWCSHRDSYRCLLKNLSAISKILLEGESNFHISPEVNGLVLDEDFEQELLKFMVIFDGTCELINKCQQNNFNIAAGLEEWLKLDFPHHDERLETVLENRLKKVVKPIKLAANFLHPVYNGKRFIEKENYTEMANSFFKGNLYDNGLKGLSAYKEQTGIFNVLHQKGVKCPQTFSTLVQTHHPGLAEFAKILMRIPSSTASLERLFSQLAFIHNKLRNRLGTEKSKKLIHVYYTLKLDAFDFEYFDLSEY